MGDAGRDQDHVARTERPGDAALDPAALGQGRIGDLRVGHGAARDQFAPSLQHDGVFRLVGVNSDICVMFTAMELDRMFRDVRLQVVKDACASISPNEWAVFEYYARDSHFKNYELV